MDMLKEASECGRHGGEPPWGHVCLRVSERKRIAGAS